MDTEKINALLCALETGSLSAAAQKLDYTPSGISRMMAALEAETGFPLLIRSRTGLRATRECEAMLPYFRHVSEAAADISRIADNLCGLESGEVFAGTPYPAYFRPLSRLMAAFSSCYPQIRVGLIEGMSTELAECVSTRRADFCVISKRDGDFDFEKLCDDPMVALVSPDDSLVKKGFVTAHDLTKRPFIMLHPEVETDCSRYLAKHRVTPDIRFTCRDTYAVYHMVEAGLGITIDNGIFAKQSGGSVCALPLKPTQNIAIGIATPRASLLSPAAKRFLEMSRAYF